MVKSIALAYFRTLKCKKANIEELVLELKEDEELQQALSYVGDTTLNEALNTKDTPKKVRVIILKALAVLRVLAYEIATYEYPIELPANASKAEHARYGLNKYLTINYGRPEANEDIVRSFCVLRGYTDKETKQYYNFASQRFRAFKLYSNEYFKREETTDDYKRAITSSEGQSPNY